MELLLKQGELLDLGQNLRGLSIICQSGTCWLTLAGDSRDFILRNGQQFKVPSKGKLLLCATDPCRLELVARATTARHPLVASALSLQ